MKKKILALTLVFALALALGIGGTVAWLTAQTDPVVNTFTVGDINITLAETTGNNYTFVPGDTLAKDPKVTVLEGSEASYLFVKVTDSNNTITDENNNNKIINWEVNTAIWTPVNEHPGYWYKEVAQGVGSDGFAVFTDNISTDTKVGSVKISEQVTKEMVNTLNTNKPTITVTAAAVQKDNVADVTAAWAKLPTAFTTTP